MRKNKYRLSQSLFSWSAFLFLTVPFFLILYWYSLCPSEFSLQILVWCTCWILIAYTCPSTKPYIFQSQRCLHSTSILCRILQINLVMLFHLLVIFFTFSWQVVNINKKYRAFTQQFEYCFSYILEIPMDLLCLL